MSVGEHSGTTPQLGARQVSARRLLVHRLRQNPLTIIGAMIIALVLLVVVFAPFISPFDPNRVDLVNRLANPSLTHPFGTDETGRDLLSRVIWGSRISVTVGLSIVAISVICGTALGLISGVNGGWLDTAIMRTMDVLLSFPNFVMALALASALGPDLVNAMLAVAIVRIPYYVRLARAQSLSLREMNYVKAAITFGVSRAKIIQRHILPNSASPIIVQATLDVGNAMLTAAALSFIGLGAQQPTAEWGAMVSAGREYMLDQPWYAAFPGLAIFVTAVGFNLLGDGLRDLLDPKLRER